MKTSEFSNLYEELCGAHPKNFNTEGQKAIWTKKFGKRDVKLFGALVDQLSVRETFPSMSLALHVYDRLAGAKGQKDYQAKKNVLPDRVKNMTDEEILVDYKLLSSFLEAYPFPDYPVDASQQTCKQIDQQYYDRMRKAGIDPDEPTHPKMVKWLMADLNRISPPSFDMGRTYPKWQDSLKNYVSAREQKDFQEIKILLRETAV